MSRAQRPWFDVLAALLSWLVAIYSYMGVVQASSFMVSNPEAEASFRRAALIWSGIGIAAGLIGALAAIRFLRRKRTHSPDTT